MADVDQCFAERKGRRGVIGEAGKVRSRKLNSPQAQRMIETIPEAIASGEAASETSSGFPDMRSVSSRSAGWRAEPESGRSGRGAGVPQPQASCGTELAWGDRPLDA